VEPVEIRWATLDDLAGLKDVFRRSSWSNAGDRPLLIEHPEFLELSHAGVREGRTRVAVAANGAVVGFSSIRHGDGSFEIEDLFVDPDHMRRGNDHALAFYARAGFVPQRRVRLEHGEATRLVLTVG
jgi:ribosomal protein S18 acetylase RimI-like enzyme